MPSPPAVLPAAGTIATRSVGCSWLSNSASDCLTSGSRFGGAIEPDVSIRNTRFARGRLAGWTAYPLMPIRMILRPSDHGLGKIDTEVRNGSVAVAGLSYAYGK